MNLLDSITPAFAPKFYRPRVGRFTRVFLSVSDRDFYEAGYTAHPHQPDRPIEQHGPAWDGYFDREDEVVDAFDEENEWGDDAV